MTAATAATSCSSPIPQRRDLSGFRSNQKVKAGRGGAGGGSLSTGERGEDVVLVVPVGTQVLDADERLVADLAHPGARVVVAKGGGGGRGNKRFASPTRQTPRYAEVGMPGDEGEIELRLKLLADAAFVGLPNAGKSSLLTRISNARPKVAEYPFTTLSPVLGTVESSEGRQLVVADVPGLIEGASEGIGLGHEFLAHLERARVLLHAIDSSEGDADDRWRTIDAELAAYGAGLDERQQIVVLNKTDLSPDPPAFGIEDERIIRVFRVSAATGAGIEELRRALFELVPQEEVVPALEQAELVDYPRLPAASRRAARSACSGPRRGFRVTGKPPEPEQLEAILKAAGAREGDEVAARRRGARVESRRSTAAHSTRRTTGTSQSRTRRRSSSAAAARRARRRGAGTQGRRPCRRRRGSSSRAPRSRTTTCGSIRTRARSTCCADERVRRSALRDRGRPVLRLPRLEGAGCRARAGSARRRHAARLPAGAARRRCCARLEHPDRVDLLRRSSRIPAASRDVRALAAAGRAARRARSAGGRSADRGARPLPRRLTSAGRGYTGHAYPDEGR